MAPTPDAPAQDGSRPGRAKLLVALGLVALAMLVPDRHGITTIAEANTGVRVYAVQAWVHYDTWSLEEILCRLHPSYSPIDLSVRGGLPELQKAPGLSWVAVPVYAAAAAANGGERLPTHWSLTFLATVCVLLPLLVVTGLLARRMGPRLGWQLAGLLAVTTLAASPLFVYGTLFMDYGLATALLVAALLALRRESPAWWALGGLLLGLAGCTNYVFWPLGALVGAVELLRRFRHEPRWRAFAAWTLAGTALPLAALLAYHQVMWGSPFATGYTFTDIEAHRGRTVPDTPLVMLGKALFTDPKHGIFRFAPWTLLGLLGLGLGLRRRDLRYWSATGLLVTVACLVFTAFWQAEFKDDAAFGRHTVPAFPWLALGLALFVREARDALAGRSVMRGLVFGLVGATLAYATMLQFVTGWTFPYHPLQLESPVWQLNVPLFVNGVHTPIVDPDPWRVPGVERLGGHWGWVAATAVALLGAFLVPWLGDPTRRARGMVQQVTGAVAGMVLLGALIFGGLLSNPAGPADRAAAQAIVARRQAGIEPTAAEEALVRTVAQDRAWYRKVGEEIVGSYYTRDDAGWSERGYDETNRWCRVAGGAGSR